MAKESKSLLNKTSKKPKKENKYSEMSPPTKKEYKFEVTDKVKLIYQGTLHDYKNQTCIVVKKSTRNQNQYYKVKFDDGEIAETSVAFLKTTEEYQQWLLDQENRNNEDDQNSMSEFEIELMKRGIESHKNYNACLSPLILVQQMQCDKCCYFSRCVYKNKGNYKRFRFN